MQNKIKEIYTQKLLTKEPALREDDIQLNFILRYISKKKNSTILDAGCGNGNYAFYLSSLGYENIFAVDLFEEINTDKFEYQESSIDTLLFEDASFDFIYSNSVLYYLDDPKDGIVEFKRVLKDDGILVFTAHTKYSFFTLWRIIKRDIFKLKEMEHLEGVKFYSGSYYRQILEEQGFEILVEDGYGVSFFLYPFYQKASRMFEKYFIIKLPRLPAYVNDGLIGKIKSEISYHSVFVARKRKLLR